MNRPAAKYPSKDQLIMGIHTLNELLRYAPNRIVRVYTSARYSKERKSDLLKECERRGIPVEEVSEDNLTKICGSDSHQSFAAQVKPRKFYDVKEFLKETDALDRVLVLMCDSVFDPGNFGALIRTAECFGVNGVAWSKNRGSDLTPVSAKSSCGASEWMNLIRISNLAEAASAFQKAGFEVVSAALQEGSQDAFKFRFAKRTVLIVGSEGEGIQPLILKRSDHVIHIPMSGKIDSLNVAQAATSLLTCYRLQQ